MNRIRRRPFEPMTDEVGRGWRKLHRKELNNLYFWQNNILSVEQQPCSSLGRLIFEVSISQTIKRTPSGAPLNEWSTCRRGRYLYNTQQNQHVLYGIRNRDPSNQAASDLRLRWHGHLDRWWDILGWTNQRWCNKHSYDTKYW
jgi:hypothetical protein